MGSYIIDKFQDVIEAPGRDAAEVEHDGRPRGLRVQHGLLLQEGPQNRGRGGEDDLVSFEGFDRAVEGVGGQGHVEEVVHIAN